ncbi:fatty acid desaturase [Bradyrhizobium sp.]|uniref:acyl-CoA desaturase n=1 Tax=Bradyrhizobium sp. TaxID=376 RepID=UPI000A50895A|nr:fatty acid desaturase [Bradyrhizobium sp.]
MTTARVPTSKAAALPVADYAAPVTASGRLSLPAGVRPFQLNWPYIIVIAGYHVVALLAFLPGYFSWSGLILAMLLTHLCGLFGINLCYHRLLTHRGLKCPKWLEHSMVIVAMSCLQETPARWVAIHRRHHQFADEQPDPHSPLASFFWSHIGWILVHQPELSRLGIYERYAKDILRDRFYVALERYGWLVWINLIQMPLFFAAGFAAAWLLGQSPEAATQAGLSILMFGVFVRTVLVWHITWAVNSVTHVWGYRSYDTDEDSRNNIVVGLISNGEGWHNNHHADPRSARHGHRWWEMDNTWLTIRFLERIGLATDVVAPSAHLRAQAAKARLITRGSNGVPAE